MFSWLITNLLFSIPTWIWTSIALVGLFIYLAAGFFDRIPTINLQAELARILGVLAMVFGVFMWGGSGFASVYKAQLEEKQKALEIAEEKAKQVNVVIEERIVYKDKIIKQKQQIVYRYIDREVIKYDTKFVPGGACEIPKPFINALNAGASGNTEELNKLIGSVNDAAKPIVVESNPVKPVTPITTKPVVPIKPVTPTKVTKGITK